MTDETQNLYNTLIDYEGDQDLDVNQIADHQAMQLIARSNFNMQKKPLGEVLSERQFAVPEYQRLFSWQKKHHRELWSDIQEFVDAEFRAGENNVSDVFFSSMYFAVDEKSATHEIIDGQQRLTSIHLLLRVILEELQTLESANEFENETIARLCAGNIKQIKTVLYKFESVMAGDTPRLSLNKHDDEFFEALISGPRAQLEYLFSDEREYIDGRRGEATQIQDLITEFGIEESVVEDFAPEESKFKKYIPVYDSNVRLLDAYKFYQGQVRKVLDGRDDPKSKTLALLNLSNYIQRSYYVGEFIIRQAEPDFRMQIFEILNDRGLELTKIDRIRATVVNAFFDEDDRDPYIEKWEDIVVAFATDSSQIDTYLSVYLSIVDSDIDTIGEASSELTNAFATRNLESDVEPRFKDLETARKFLDHAEELVHYYKAITNGELKPQDLELTEYDTECQEILVRLNDQQMDQWIPFVLALYHFTNTHPSGDEEALYETLETVEKLNFRRLLVGEDPNIFQEVFIEAVHQFLPSAGERQGDPYEKSRQFLITEMQSSTPALFGDRFRDTITLAQSWNPHRSKLLFGKIANQRFRDEGTIIDRRLNMGNIHLEHVFPQSLVYDSEEPVWLREFFKLEETEKEIVSEIHRYIDLIQRDEDELGEEEKQQQASIEDFIQQRFIQDIGNFVLLRDSDNISASNRPLVEKIPQYYNEADDFTDIYPNRYFTSEEGPVDEAFLERLLNQVEQKREGVREAIDLDIVEYFNSFWTYESMQDRRVSLIMDILDTVSFEKRYDEFGLETEADAVRDRIRNQTEAEFEKRLSMRSL